MITAGFFNKLLGVHKRGSNLAPSRIQLRNCLEKGVGSKVGDCAQFFVS